MENTATDRENLWLSIQEAAEQLGVNPRTVRRYIRLGRIDVSRISNKVVRVRQADIDRFMETGVGKAATVVDLGETEPKVEPEVPAALPVRHSPSRPSRPQPAKPAGFTPGRFA